MGGRPSRIARYCDGPTPRLPKLVISDPMQQNLTTHSGNGSLDSVENEGHSGWGGDVSPSVAAMIASHQNITLAQSAISMQVVNDDTPADYSRKGKVLLTRMVFTAVMYFAAVLLGCGLWGWTLRVFGVGWVPTLVAYLAAEAAFAVWWTGR